MGLSCMRLVRNIQHFTVYLVNTYSTYCVHNAGER